MKIDQKTINKMSVSGIYFYSDIPHIFGCKTIDIEPEDVALFLDDKVLYAAKYYGVSVLEFQSWIEANGYPQCGGKTVKGKRCKNIVSGPACENPKSWLYKEGDYCTVHGGEASVKVR